MQSLALRNDFCLCHLHSPSRFCLCQDSPVFLCEACKLPHLQDSSNFHDLYPYDMLRLYQTQGQSGLVQRKAMLQVCRTRLQAMKELEAQHYAAAIAALEGVRASLESVHQAFTDYLVKEARELQSKLLRDLIIEAGGLAGHLLGQGDPPKGLFSQLYGLPTLHLLPKALVRLGNCWGKTLLDYFAAAHRTAPSSFRIHRSLSHKSGLSQSAYLTPRRSKISPQRLLKRKLKPAKSQSGQDEGKGEISGSPLVGRARKRLGRADTMLSAELGRKPAIRLSKKLVKMAY